MSNAGTFRCVTNGIEQVFEGIDSVQLHEYARPNGILAVIWRENPDMTDTQIAAVSGISEFSAEGLFVNWSENMLAVAPHLTHPLGEKAQGWGVFWHEYGLHARLPTQFECPTPPLT